MSKPKIKIMKVKPVGTIHPKNTMILREVVGTLTSEGESEKRIYDATLILPSMQPLLKSGATGKYFTLSWQDIVELAIKAGIDED